MKIKKQDKKSAKSLPVKPLPIATLNEWEMSQINAAGDMHTGLDGSSEQVD